MAPSRFQAKEKKREVTPYRDEPGPASLIPMRPVTPGPLRPESPVDANVYFSDRPVTPAPAEWSSYDAPINFTWVIPDELCGMGWPKSRDQACADRKYFDSSDYFCLLKSIFNSRDTSFLLPHTHKSSKGRNSDLLFLSGQNMLLPQ